MSYIYGAPILDVHHTHFHICLASHVLELWN